MISLYFILFVTVICASAQDTRRVYGGGRPVNITEVPYMAVFLSQKVDENNSTIIHTYRCCASIIHPQFLVTAGHCKKDNTWTPKVVVGTDILMRDYGEYHEIEDLILHPKYKSIEEENGSYADYDIMIIKLKNELALSEKVNLIKMVGSNFQLEEDMPMQAYGFGSENNVFSNQLLEVTLSAWSFDECKYAHNKITDRMICAIGETGITSRGDSGGPLVYNGLLVGMTSWGRYLCDIPTSLGIFASIPALRSFVDDVLRTHH